MFKRKQPGIDSWATLEITGGDLPTSAYAATLLLAGPPRHTLGEGIPSEHRHLPTLDMREPLRHVVDVEGAPRVLMDTPRRPALGAKRSKI